jgi:Zn-dependent protease with chaperone function
MRTIGVVVGVPLLLLAGLYVGVAQLETQFRQLLIAQLGPIPDSANEAARLASLCQHAEVRAKLTVCSDFLLGQALEVGGVAAVAISVFSLILIVGVAKFAGHNRPRMAAVFRPALTTLQVGLVILILLEGSLAVGGGYLLELSFTGGYHPAILLGIGIVALIAALGVLRAILATRHRTTANVNGLVVHSFDQPRLVEFADDIAKAVGATPPDVVAVGFDPTFFVIEGEMHAIDGPHRGRLLYVSLPLARTLSLEELRAIIGHEMGHFKGDDTAYSLRFAPVYRGATEAFLSVSGASRGLYGLILAPTLQILGLFIAKFSMAERAVQRERELEADGVGAGAASPRDLATALIKLQAFVPLWNDILSRTSRSLGLGNRAENPSVIFGERVHQGAAVTSLEHLEETVVPHPTDSHPVLRDRLSQLGVEYGSVAESALSGVVADPAIQLLDGVDTVERRLTDALTATVKDELGFAGPGFDIETALRAEAEAEPAVARALAIVEQAHAGTLLRPVNFSMRWSAVIPLALAPHPNPRPFVSNVDVMTLPGGDQQLVVGFATEDTPPAQILGVGVELKPVGINSPQQRRAGHAEDYYAGADRLVVVQSVGTGDVAAQLAGLFFMPVTDPLNGPRRLDDALSTIRPDLNAWQRAYAKRSPEGGD